MTQLDLPQVSLQRYVDLLRRKTWQVIPVSLLGLLLGGLVALLIPRYYVAEIEINHQRLPGTKDVDRLGDPMAELVGNARSTIPSAIEATFKDLAWPDAQIADDFSRREYVRAVRGRLEIRDENASEKRTYALLRLVYRDRDGKRAAAFLNRLVPVWNKKVFDELRANASKALAEANTTFDRANRAWQTASDGAASVLQRYKIDPNLARDEKPVIGRAAEGERARLVDDIDKFVIEAATLQEEVKQQQGLVDALPHKVPIPVVPTDSKLLDSINKNPVYAKLWLDVQSFEVGRPNPGYPGYAALKKEYEENKKKLLEVTAKINGVAEGMAGAGEMDNPAFVEARKVLLQKQTALTHAGGQVARAKQQLQAWTERQTELVQGFAEFSQKVKTLEDAEKARTKAGLMVAEASEILAGIDRQDIVKIRSEAIVPPAPTEPNIFLVALIGCVAGLGAAVALILLLDLVQGTFKTLADVERGLPVPVLGGMAHLELAEDRLRMTSRRRRASVLVGAILILVVAVVTIWKVDPTRVPSFVNDALKMLLGEG